MSEYFSVALDVAEADAEEMGASLFDLGATGVEQRDATTIVRGNGATLIASFASREDAMRAIDQIDASLSPRLEKIVGDEWLDEYKKYFHPFHIVRDVVIRPPWEEFAAKENERVLVLEPGRAFGTGLHETTALVCDAMTEIVRGKRVLDVGCGSGILGIVALALGAKSVRAIDIDPEAIAVTIENSARNGLSIEADTTGVAALSGTWDVAVANIEARTLAALAPALTSRVKGTLILSGILETQANDVIAAYATLTLRRKLTKGEWVALVFS